MKAKIFSIIVTLVLFQAGTVLYAQTYQWSLRNGGTGTERAWAVITDGSGAIINAGAYTGTVDFDPGPGTLNYNSGRVSGYNAYIQKVLPNQTLAWARSFTGTAEVIIYSIAVGSDNSVYATGTYQLGSVDFDPGPGTFTVSSLGGPHAFIVKLNAAGNFVWQKEVKASSSDVTALSIDVNAAGALAVAGEFTGTSVDFDPGAGSYPLTSIGQDAFLLRLDTTGSFVSAATYGAGTAVEGASCVKLDASGNAYLGGSFNVFSTIFSLSNSGLYDAFVARIAPNGTVTWAKKFGSTGNEKIMSIELGSTGSVYITGTFQNTVDFDPNAGTYNLSATGSATITFMVKLGTSGSFTWARHISASADNTPTDIAADTSGNVYTIGYYYTSADFDPSATSTFMRNVKGGCDLFMLKLDSSGNFVTAQCWGGKAFDLPYSITVVSPSDYYISGTFQDTVDFDLTATTANLISLGVYDAFVVRYGICAAPPLPVNTTPTANLTVCVGMATTLSAGGSGTINWYNNTSDTATIVATGNNFNTPALNGNKLFYLDQTNTCAISARTSVLVTTLATPPTVTGTTAAQRCDSGTVTLSASASSGTINWHSAATGGTLLGTGTTFTTPAIGTSTAFYAEAAVGLCTSTSRSAVAATIIKTPVILSSTPGSRCGTGAVTLSVTTSSGTVNWFASDTGGTALTSGSSFNTPSLAANTTYYASATLSGCTSTPRTPVTATIKPVPTVSSSAGATRCDSGTVVLSATASPGIIRWFAAATGGTQLDSGNSFITPKIYSTTNFYAEAALNGCVSTRTAVAATVNTTPIVNSSSPGARCGSGTVTIGATASSGAINWFAASSGGTSLSGGNTFTTPTLTSTATYFAEASDKGCINALRTPVVASINAAPPAPANTTPVANLTICSGNSASLSASGSGNISWYNLSTGGTPLSSGSSFTTPPLNTGTTFYAEDSNTCGSGPRTAITVTVKTTPSITGTTPASRCEPGTLTLLATASAGIPAWFATATGGAAVGNGTSFTTPSISATSTYYVETSFQGCTSARTAVTATVNTTPVVNSTTPGSRCGAGTVMLAATPSTGSINWFANASGGAVLGSGTTFTTAPISFTTTYYAEAINNGCISPARIAVTAVVNALPDSAVTLNATTLTATENGATYQWLDCNLAKQPIAGETGKTFTPVQSGIYAVEITKNTCKATSICTTVIMTGTSNKTTVAAEIYPNPASDLLLLRTPVKGAKQIHIYDVNGRLILYMSSKLELIPVDISRLAKGLYHVQIQTGEDISRAKFVKE